MGNSGEEMSQGSLMPGAGVFVYLNRQMEGEERWGVGERWKEIGKSWGKVEKSLCESVEVCVGL